MIDKTNF